MKAATHSFTCYHACVSWLKAAVELINVYTLSTHHWFLPNQCQSTLTISIYINPVKHAVSEILGGCFVILVAVDCTDGLWGNTSRSVCSIEARGLLEQVVGAPLWYWGARVGLYSHYRPHHRVWSTSAACVPSFLSSPGWERPRIPWSLCSRPAKTGYRRASSKKSDIATLLCMNIYYQDGSVSHLKETPPLSQQRAVWNEACQDAGLSPGPVWTQETIFASKGCLSDNLTV